MIAADAQTVADLGARARSHLVAMRQRPKSGDMSTPAPNAG